MNEQPAYYSILPSNVRYDKRLSATSKLLYSEITALTQKNGECFASTSYFAELYGMTKNSIQKMLKQLETLGYISRRVTYKKGTKQIDKRYIKIINYPSVKNYTTPSVKNYTTPSVKNYTDNNTRESNNTRVIISPKPPEGCSEYVREIIRYFSDDGSISTRNCNKLIRFLERTRDSDKNAYVLLKFYEENKDDYDFAPVINSLGEFILKYDRLVRFYENNC